MAKRFAAGGYSVALVSRKAESSQPTYDEIIADGGKALIVTADTGAAQPILLRMASH